MAIFNSYVKLPEGISEPWKCGYGSSPLYILPYFLSLKSLKNPISYLEVCHGQNEHGNCMGYGHPTIMNNIPNIIGLLTLMNE